MRVQPIAFRLRILSGALAWGALAIFRSAAGAADGDPANPPSSPLVRHVEDGPQVTVSYNSGKSVGTQIVDRLAERVGLRGNEVVNVSIQYGSAFAGRAVSITPLDGGRIVGREANATVGTDGSLSFKFQATKLPGVYEIALHDQEGDDLGLQFWVFDEQNPKKNPPALYPAD
jgi:hypothetical protein